MPPQSLLPPSFAHSNTRLSETRTKPIFACPIVDQAAIPLDGAGAGDSQVQQNMVEKLIADEHLLVDDPGLQMVIASFRTAVKARLSSSKAAVKEKNTGKVRREVGPFKGASVAGGGGRPVLTDVSKVVQSGRQRESSAMFHFCTFLAHVSDCNLKEESTGGDRVSAVSDGDAQVGKISSKSVPNIYVMGWSSFYALACLFIEYAGLLGRRPSSSSGFELVLRHSQNIHPTGAAVQEDHPLLSSIQHWTKASIGSKVGLYSLLHTLPRDFSLPGLS